MPCSEEDSKDIPYVQAVFDFIESNPEQFDASKIYAQGFSQNSMFSAYIGFCFNEKVLGIWQGGSGMAYTGQPPNLPGCQAHVIFSVISYTRNVGLVLEFEIWRHFDTGQKSKLFTLCHCV